MSKMKILLILLIGLAMAYGAPSMDGVPALACMDVNCEEPDGGPLCAIDASGQAQTFANYCHLELASCRDSIFYAIVRDGEC